MPKKLARNPVSKPLITPPDPPDSLTGEARQYWLRVAPELVKIGAVTMLHLEALECLCRLWAEYASINLCFDADPRARFNDTGATPIAKRHLEILNQLQRMWAKFGMTPDALNKLGRSNVDPESVTPVIHQFAKKKYSG